MKMSAASSLVRSSNGTAAIAPVAQRLTTRLLQQLSDILDGEEGCDTMGMPLLDHARIPGGMKGSQKDPEGI